MRMQMRPIGEVGTRGGVARHNAPSFLIPKADATGPPKAGALLVWLEGKRVKTFPQQIFLS